MELLTVLALLFPLAGFALLIFSPHSRTLVAVIGCGTVFISFLCSLGLLYLYTSNGMQPYDFVLYRWISLGDMQVDMSFRIDALSLLMSLIITGVGFLIHFYSIGYMEHEEELSRFFACMNFFIFSMLLLVYAGNLTQMFIGWEGVGLASYLLIGFWYTRPAAAAAATKAFVVNRIGDIGLLLALLLSFQLFGTTNIAEMTSQASANAWITTLALLLFWGAIGKSAQIPLHVWLPDAMEGPTPVSALIHAATMVTAGVYLVVRFHVLFNFAPFVLNIIAVVGSLTALYAAICAMGQTDLKRVLAYSTVSQLGFMFLACGIGAFYAAMFHLTTHAFVKALLFLAAGNVIHGMQGNSNMEKMGGLLKHFPYTHWMFLIGVLAMSAVPLFSVFYSKDLILEQTHVVGHDLLFLCGIATSALTAFYLLRAYLLTFWGRSVLEEKIQKAISEAPATMLVPASVLAALAIVGGIFGTPFDHIDILETFLAHSGVLLAHAEADKSLFLMFDTWMSIGATVIGFSAAVLSFIYYEGHLRRSWKWLRSSLYVDALYQNTLVNPLKAVSNLFSGWSEPMIFEGSIYGAVKATNYSAQMLQLMQNGQIRSYIAWMAIIIAVLYLFLGL